MPIGPSHCLSDAGNAPSPISVEVIGKAGQVHELAQQPARLRARIDDAAAGVEHRPLGRRHHLDRVADRALVRIDLRPVGAGA